MIRTAIFNVLLFWISVSFSQNRKGQFHLNQSSEMHELYVRFSATIDFSSGDYITVTKNQIPGFETLQNEFSISFERGILMEEEALYRMEQNALQLNNDDGSIKILKNILKVNISKPTNERLLELATKLEELSNVDYCSLISLEPIRPPFDIMPVTPNFEVNQNYIAANPGVNMQHAWNLGLIGSGIKIRDVEYGFNKNHEEFHQINAFLATGMTVNSNASVDYTEHGTAVFGIVYAHKGNYGVSGMAYGATEMILFPEWQQTGYNRIFAITQSIQNSSPGDIIIFEMQTGGQNDQFVPAEYNNVVWDLTLAASNSGIIIVAAAGNGNQNLNSAFYQPYMNRGDSGAIIVGAGTSTLAHNKMWYSTHGTRVDVQAWGENVYSTGYGDAITIGGDFNQRYTNFAGTSSATPIVASCAIVLQSYHHSLNGNYLTGPQMRELLKVTGIAQGNPGAGAIGPIPNMQIAIQKIYDDYVLLNLATNELTNFSVFPNPASDKITLMVSNDLTKNAQIEIFNSLGQKIYQSSVPDSREINISGYNSGVYFLKISDGKFSTVKKIAKR
ncbi:S8/S53 family peptidase [Flavobacterium sp. UBA6135]|uniref:S8/S53 family peptidase n=1 Tax=Flavobacterium sp. UBA6135 TaxID=1946553 RepID=UPI0025C41ADA|nr:S8/S53 family peptidase [Flavobacterium sp. UBA6135]